MNFNLYLVFNFFIYGYLGWVLENVFSYFTKGKMQEDGFLYSPFKPMYAFAMTVLIYLNSTINNYFIILLLCLVVPTSIELITGLIMRYYFRKDYWDYSKVKYNFKGIICLDFSIYWIALSFFTLKVIQPLIIDNLFNKFNFIWVIIIPLQGFVLLMDFVMTLKKFNLNKRII